MGKNAENILAMKMAGSELIRHVDLHTHDEKSKDNSGRVWDMAQFIQSGSLEKPATD